jgi:hypothetical protein
MKTVPDRLEELGKLYRHRNAIYGNNYMEFGAIMKAMFPNGLQLKSEEDFNRFTIFVQVFAKFTRYAKSINSGGHADSLDDISVYCQMIREYDEYVKQIKPTPHEDFSKAIHVDWGYKSQTELEFSEMRGG